MDRRGFTTIELAVVIVILALLAAVAAPRLLSLSNESKIATLEHIEGVMRSGMRLVYLKAQVENKLSGDDTININGVDVPIRNGFPSAAAGSGFKALNQQLRAWVDIDVTDRNSIIAAKGDVPQQFFSDRSYNRRIYLFFSEDFAQKSSRFGCRLEYTNDPQSAGDLPTVAIFTDDC